MTKNGVKMSAIISKTKFDLHDILGNSISSKLVQNLELYTTYYWYLRVLNISHNMNTKLYTITLLDQFNCGYQLKDFSSCLLSLGNYCVLKAQFTGENGADSRGYQLANAEVIIVQQF